RVWRKDNISPAFIGNDDRRNDRLSTLLAQKPCKAGEFLIAVDYAGGVRWLTEYDGPRCRTNRISEPAEIEPKFVPLQRNQHRPESELHKIQRVIHPARNGHDHLVPAFCSECSKHDV